MISLSHYLVLGGVLFAIAVLGIFLNRKNVIILLMAIELMLLAVNMNFIAFSHYLGDIHGPLFALFTLTPPAAAPALPPAPLAVPLASRNSRQASQCIHHAQCKWRAFQADYRAVDDVARCAARSPQSDRHQERLRSRTVRRLHGPG